MKTLVSNGLGFYPTVLDNFFNNDFFEKNPLKYTKSYATLPSVNISENEKEYQIDFAIPGKKREDFKIEIHEDVLSVSSETKEETKEENANYTRREFSYNSFKRSFTIPELSDKEAITAKYCDGILTVCIPKKEEAKANPIRQIEIQ